MDYFLLCTILIYFPPFPPPFLGLGLGLALGLSGWVLGFGLSGRVLGLGLLGLEVSWSDGFASFAFARGKRDCFSFRSSLS